MRALLVIASMLTAFTVSAQTITSLHDSPQLKNATPTVNVVEPISLPDFVLAPEPVRQPRRWQINRQTTTTTTHPDGSVSTTVTTTNETVRANRNWWD